MLLKRRIGQVRGGIVIIFAVGKKRSGKMAVHADVGLILRAR